MRKQAKLLSSYVQTILLVSFISLLMNCSDDKPPLVPCAEDLEFGIYSESASDGLALDVDSFLGTFRGGGASFSELVDDTNEKQEGGISKRATMSVDASQNQFAGWFVQWGTAGSPDSETKNMSDYDGGTLSFWVKSPINLEVGIRSGNVAPGTERSKVVLNNFPAFKADNEWHKVSIPLSDFTGSAPKADLNRIKIFLVVSSNTPSGGTGGEPKTFWIDDVRWERICP